MEDPPAGVLPTDAVGLLEQTQPALSRWRRIFGERRVQAQQGCRRWQGRLDVVTRQDPPPLVVELHEPPHPRSPRALVIRCQRESRLACRRCPRARLWAWMALARVMVNCRAFRVSLAAALVAFWLRALRASACWPAAACSGEVCRSEAFVLFAREGLLRPA